MSHIAPPPVSMNFDNHWMQWLRRVVYPSLRFHKEGTFTCDAAATTTILDSDVRADSRVVIMATNVHAAQLMASGKALYVSAKTASTSFSVSTADGGSAIGDETFDYIIVH